MAEAVMDNTVDTSSKAPAEEFREGNAAEYAEGKASQNETADNSAADAESNEKLDTDVDISYEETLDNDFRELRKSFSQIGEQDGIECLKNPIRYGELRELGLSPSEAYLASGGVRVSYDNRSHLTSSVPTPAASAFQGIPGGELKMMREIFGEISDAEIQRLYKRVTV